ncbi:hypothetical protein HH219_16695 [Pseudoalteromonas sp. NEC-BIFX-2020_015]|uniref:hypothetical protein n=1 Tax=Pseudoalteromonas sp. NEC-BIFX-2020_015 TaxID=2729544 RepID=UPI0014615F50|nr:hypothetical protein [Pseudoalteromonas sp. NEC-BIFX-2020_015]NMR27150.1 hypothetical protein [Pseudoalteromonas sp. NEC-BIFX-2020_015]
MNNVCFEVVKWKSKPGISDGEMVTAINDLAVDLKFCKGFLQQTLYKDSNNEWVDIYYWEDEASAHASNDIMAEKKSFSALMSLIDPASVSLDVLSALQSSGKVTIGK